MGWKPFPVHQGSALSGRAIGDIDFSGQRLILFGVLSGCKPQAEATHASYDLKTRRFLFNPGTDFILQASDPCAGFWSSVEHCSFPGLAGTENDLRARDKIILFSASPMGLSVAAQLRSQGSDPLLVDDDEVALEVASAKGFRTACMDYREDEELKAIGIGRDVGLIFCLFEKDPENVFLTISARALDSKLEIVSLTQSGESAQTLQAAGSR